MSDSELIRRQRETIRNFRHMDRSRARIEAAAHKDYEQATAAAETAFQTTIQSAMNTRKHTLVTAEESCQTSHRDAASKLDDSRKKVQQQWEIISTTIANGQAELEKAGLSHLWPKIHTKIGTVGSYVSSNLVDRVGITDYYVQLHLAIEEWQKDRDRRRQRNLVAIALVALSIVIGGALFQSNQEQLRFQTTATAQAQIARATATTIASLPFPDRAKELTGIEFVFVPQGEFTMGNLDVGTTYIDERPSFTLFLNDFWIGRTEVTNAQWQMFVDANGYNIQNYWTPEGWAWRTQANITRPGCRDNRNLNVPDQPVVCISWFEAIAYTRWLSSVINAEVRLPSEAEWEKAARGTDGRLYPWGDADPHTNLLNFNKNVGRTTPAGLYPDGASPYGALDMAGNAWEWVSSFYAKYPYRANDGRENLEGGDSRVLRGGAWYLNRFYTRSTDRDHKQRAARTEYIGVRVASPGF